MSVRLRRPFLYLPGRFLCGSVAEAHLHFPSTWVFHCKELGSSSFDRFIDSSHHPPLPSSSHPRWVSRDGAKHASLAFLPADLRAWAALPCVLCGSGDNSVQHWLRFCPVPALVGSYFLNCRWTVSDWFLHSQHSLRHRAIIAALWVGSRQFVHERSVVLPSPSPPQPFIVAKHLLDRVYAPPFQPSGFLPLSPSPTISGCFFDHLTFHSLSLEKEGLPIFYGPAPVVPHTIPEGFLLSIFPLTSSLHKKLFAFQSQLSRPPNCTIQYKLCSCGRIHGYLQALCSLEARGLITYPVSDVFGPPAYPSRPLFGQIWTTI